MAAIQEEKARLKKSKKAEAAEVPTEDSDSDSDSDISMNMIEEISPTKKQKLEKYKEPNIPDNEKSEEEKAYLKFIHADEDSDHPLIED